MLAIAGGQPRFAVPLHVGRPNVGDRQRLLERIGAILDRRWLSNDGPVLREFEEGVRELAGVRHCVAMCNATAALEIAVGALGLTGEVIVPSYTFVATAHALLWRGVTPVFADIDPTTLNLDPAAVEAAITPRTTGIIGVHVFGRPCDTDALEEIGRRHGLKVFYDAAHAVGCTHRGRRIGGFGACEILSFHATKVLNSFEGGAILTDDDDLAGRCRLMRNFGFAGFDRVVSLGINGKMHEVSAAMGLSSLEGLGEVIAVNRRNYEAYEHALAGLPGVQLLGFPAGETCNYHYVVARVLQGASPLDRDELVEVLHAEDVLARKYFWPGCHRMEPYRTTFPEASRSLPNTELRAAEVIVLPTGQAVSPEDVAAIGEIVREALGGADAVRAALQRPNR